MGTPRKTNAVWFFVALVGGGAGVWWAKNAFDSAWFAAIVAAGVVFALTIYYVLNDEDAPEEEGDNVYYLGLLFTLVSLMFTLLELFGTDTGGEGGERIRSLLENFGIALTSTIAGIACRVAVQNWQRTEAGAWPGSVNDAAMPASPPGDATARDMEMFNRHLLGRIARDLTQGANALARFHRIVRSHASDSEDHLRQYSESLKRESAEFKDTLERNAETFAEELKSEAAAALDAVGGSLGAAAKQAEDLLERLRAAHDSHLAEVREVSGSFHKEIQDASRQSLDALQRNFDAAAELSLSLARNMSAIHEQISEASDRLGATLADASDASAALGKNAHRAANSTEVLGSEVDKLRTALGEVSARANTMTDTLDAMSELHARISAGRDTEETAAAVQQIGETLRTIAAEGAIATGHAAKSAELFDALTQSIRTTGEETRLAAESLRVLAEEAAARVEILRKSRPSIFRFWKRSG